MSKEDKKKNPNWGFVSEVQRVPLFDKKSLDKTKAFAKDLYERRKEEVDECASRSGFKKLPSDNTNLVRFLNTNLTAP
jgi:hypothetical protein